MNFFDFGKFLLGVALADFDRHVTARAQFREAAGYIQPLRCHDLLNGVSHVSFVVKDVLASPSYMASVLLDMPINDKTLRAINTPEDASDNPSKISYYTGRRLNPRYPTLQ